MRPKNQENQQSKREIWKGLSWPIAFVEDLCNKENSGKDEESPEKEHKVNFLQRKGIF